MYRINEKDSSYKAILVLCVIFGFLMTGVAIAGSESPACNETQVNLFARSVDGAFDITGDGEPDLLVGAPEFHCDGGRVYIYSGASLDIVYVLFGENEGDEFGCSVSYIGDANGDDIIDFIVGAPGYDDGRGRVYIYSGETYDLIYTIQGSLWDDRFGFSVSGAGDLNNDGYDDIIVGAPGGNLGGGKVYLFLTGVWEDYWSIVHSAIDSVGYSVSGAGDLDGDGYADVIYGAPYADVAGYTDNGRIYLLSGKDKIELEVDYYYGAGSGWHLGWSVAGVGDMDGAGDDDVLACAPNANSGEGVCYYFRGEDATVVRRESPMKNRGTITTSMTGAPGDKFGFSVSGLGDFDGDGYSDFIIGAPGSNNSTGRAEVFLGGDFGFYCVMMGENEHDQFGYSVASAGDIEGVLASDFLIGGIYAECTAPPTIIKGPGKAYLYAGEDCTEISSLDQYDCDCRPGDANGDGDVNAADATYIINYVFKGGPLPTPYTVCSGDPAGDCTSTVGDAVYLISYIFKGGPPPVTCEEWINNCGGPLRK